ncbi:hypothetical protein COO91_08320 [Nostoc flagelliforme CCNUN1]|uniref:Uncharacterized protein n=1 Tax=Nostoc flagelliforme CCNUN1 TaxID=2038116 RepID=A0A2K8T3G6_9NOSO|nr:hypothetical protein COO91_08320 [Nostoc flagelliforme CCNUN1]
MWVNSVAQSQCGMGVHRQNRPPEATELSGVGMSADAVNPVLSL